MLLSGFLWVRVLLSWSAKSVSTHSSVFQLLKFSLIFLISLRFIILKKIKTICIFEDLYLKKKNPYAVILEGFQEKTKMDVWNLPPLCQVTYLKCQSGCQVRIDKWRAGVRGNREVAAGSRGETTVLWMRVSGREERKPMILRCV